MILENGLHKLTGEQKKEVYHRLNFYEGPEYISYMENCALNRRYRFGNQWTSEELQARIDNGKETLTVNRMRKILNGMVGLKTANKPKFKAIPVDGLDAPLSDLYNRLLDTAFYNSNGMEVLRNAVLLGDGDNIGYLFAYVNKLGRVAFKDLDYEQVVVDPESTDPLFRDANYIYIKKYIPISTAETLFNIEAGTFDTSVPEVWNSDLYSSQNNKRKNITKLIDTNKQYVRVYEGYTKTIEKYSLTNPDGTIRECLRERIHKETIVGYNYIFKETLPEHISEYPIIPIYADQVPSPYKFGEVHYLKEIQDYINSSLNIAIEGARLNANPETYLTEDMVDGDITEWKAQHAAGDRLFMIKPDRNGALPHTVAGAPLNNAWFSLLTFFLSEQEFMTMPNQMLGYNDQSEKVRKNLSEKREAVLDSMKISLGHLDSALGQLGKVLLQYFRAYTNPDDMLYLLNAKGIIEQYSINSQSGLDLSNDQSIENWRRQQLSIGKNPNQVEMDLDKAKNDEEYYKAIKKIFEPAKFKTTEVDVHVVAGSYSSSYSMQQFDSLMAMKQSGLNIDDEDIINKAPIENNKLVASKASMNKLLMGQNEALRADLEEKTRQLEQAMSVINTGKMQLNTVRNDYKERKAIDDQKNKNYVTKKIEGIKSHNNVVIAKKQMQHEIDLVRVQLQALLDKQKEQMDQPSSDKELTLESIL